MLEVVKNFHKTRTCPLLPLDKDASYTKHFRAIGLHREITQTVVVDIVAGLDLPSKPGL
jgi:hypothetical protein